MPVPTTPVVIVTGGTRGIGKATALKLAQQGVAVAVHYERNHEAAEATLCELRAHGTNAIAVAGDIAEEQVVVDLFEQTASELGQVTGVVNNAGIVAPLAPLRDISVQRMKRIFNVNVLGAFVVAREAARRLATSCGGPGGSIVNVSSIAARLGAANEFVDYAASKGAVDTLTIGLAKELGREAVRVNAVRPGMIDTELHATCGAPNRAFTAGKTTPIGRPGTADEVADAILWLLSDASRYVTGTLLDVSGGR